jgi:hypothetical protein
MGCTWEPGKCFDFCTIDIDYENFPYGGAVQVDPRSGIVPSDSMDVESMMGIRVNLTLSESG